MVQEGNVIKKNPREELVALGEGGKGGKRQMRICTNFCQKGEEGSFEARFCGGCVGGEEGERGVTLV